MDLENLFISLFKIFGSFIILATIYWPLALILLAVTVVMMVFSIHKIEDAKNLYGKQKEDW